MNIRSDDDSQAAPLHYLTEDDQGRAEQGAVSDDEYLEACLARADLQEIGLENIPGWAGWRVRCAVPHLLEEYRAARSAADLGRPLADERLSEAGSRLYETAVTMLRGYSSGIFPEINEPGISHCQPQRLDAIQSTVRFTPP